MCDHLAPSSGGRSGPDRKLGEAPAPERPGRESASPPGLVLGGGPPCAESAPKRSSWCCFRTQPTFFPTNPLRPRHGLLCLALRTEPLMKEKTHILRARVSPDRSRDRTSLGEPVPRRTRGPGLSCVGRSQPAQGSRGGADAPAALALSAFRPTPLSFGCNTCCRKS